MSAESEKTYDAVVALGKNLGFGWNKEKIRAQREHLAPHARINADRAAMLYKQGRTRKIVLSTGETVPGLGTEAWLMKNHIQRIWPSITDEVFILEEISKQTRTNPIEVKKELENEGIGLDNLALDTQGFHMQRAQDRFRDAGLPNVDSLPAEEVLDEMYPSILSTADYRKKMIYRGEQFREFVGRFIQSIPIVKDIVEARVDSSRS